VSQPRAEGPASARDRTLARFGGVSP